MEADKECLLDFVRKVQQFAIPIYQRMYSWECPHCEQLWDDIIRVGKTDGQGGHFIGSIVYVCNSEAHDAPLLVIDGQQRLTTLALLITALSDAVGDEEPVDGFSREKLREYLVNRLEKGEKHRKLVLSNTDRETLFSIIDGRDVPDNHSIRIADNFAFFQNRIQEQIDKKNGLAVLCHGLSKLSIVYIALSREKDKPQLVFESMNSKGLELGQADLIRNYMLMELEPERQEDLYKRYWRPMEEKFGQKAYNQKFGGFMRHYLTVVTGEIPKKGDVYVAFKKFAMRGNENMEKLIPSIRRFSRYYCAMELGQETDPDLKVAFDDVRELKVDVAYPPLLKLYSYYANGHLEQVDFLKCVRLIESYVFRRAVCGIPPNSLNKIFAAVARNLQEKNCLENMTAQFLALTGKGHFPSDDEFKEGIKWNNLYTRKFDRYCWLGRLENFERKETVPVREYSIEHIMPQNLTDAWKDSLGDDWERIHEKYLHTLGNLTLTGYNPEYSNRSFREKRDMDGGFKRSPLCVNDGLGDLDKWSEEAIQERADRLAEQAVRVWIYP